MGAQSAPSAVSWPAAVNDAGFAEGLGGKKVLMVGAGGIGCELLKTLVLSGFKDIELIDLDTIETSNLNRQFLFRKQHVGASKAEVAAEAVQKFAPGAKITAHHGNIKEGRFGLEFFQKFDIVLGGLDNMEARRHVNRLCLAAGTPLIESGTEGYKGQVTVHLKGETDCYECMPKPTPKTYPICTLRNTPDKPIHCIVWAKDMLFARLFGPPEAITDLDEQAAEDGGAEAEGGAQQPKDDPSEFLRREGEGGWDYACRVFERVFAADIDRVLTMEELWKTRSPPKPLRLKELFAGGVGGARAEVPETADSVCKALGLGHHGTWSVEENARVFLHAVAHFLASRPGDVGAASFDKDDSLAVEVVTAAANLRSIAYGIPPQTLFAAKGMAGNIIHAIATTNAIISGLIVIEAVKVVAGQRTACRNTGVMAEANIGRKGWDAQLLAAHEPYKPNKDCVVCGTGQVVLRADTTKLALKELIDQVVKKAMAVKAPSLMSDAFMYEEGEDLDEDEVAEYSAHLPKALADLPGGGLGHGKTVAIQDQDQHFSCNMIIQHCTALPEEDHPQGWALDGKVPDAAAEPEAGPSTSQAEPAPKKPAPQEDDDGVICLDDGDDGAGPSAAGGSGAKRGRGDDGAGPSSSKRARVDDGDDVIELD